MGASELRLVLGLVLIAGCLPCRAGSASEWKLSPIRQIDWRVAMPQEWDGSKELTPVEADKPLTVSVFLRNAAKQERQIPAELCREEQRGGPSLCKGVTVTVEYLPFSPAMRSAWDAEMREGKFEPLTPKQQARFDGQPRLRAVGAGQSIKAMEIDLRDWFSIDRPGFYRYRVILDPQELGFGERDPFGQCPHHLFMVGTPPTIEEYNHATPAFGEKNAERRLRRLISESLRQPTTRSTTQPADDGGWSEPAAGLVGRVEYLDWRGYAGLFIILRLKNVSTEPLALPPDEPCQIEYQRSDEQWQPLSWTAGDGAEKALRQFGSGQPFWPDDPTPLPAIVLKPGQSAAIDLYATCTPRIEMARMVRLTMRHERQPDSGIWHGTLRTPPYPAVGTLERPVTHLQSFPDHFPAFSPKGIVGLNSYVGGEVAINNVARRNADLASSLRMYDARQVADALEQRMRQTDDAILRMYLSALAARYGSERAAMELLDATLSTRYLTVINTAAALRQAMHAGAGDPPDWLVELVMGVLRDRRYVTATEPFISGLLQPISSVAESEGHLRHTLAHFGCRQAAPVLDQLAKEEEQMAADLQVTIPRSVRCLTAEAFDAVLAHACSDEAKAVERLVQLLSDERVTEQQMRMIIWRLADRRNEKAVPALLDLIRKCRHSAAVLQAIEALSVFKSKAALEGLIQCLNGELAATKALKCLYDAGVFHRAIDESLQRLTVKQ